jgi:4-hydroxybenzoate polyprenyltransferase
MKYLKLVRYQNLALIVLMQLILRYGFLNLQMIPLFLTGWQFSLLVIATVLLAAAGYVINDIMDQDVDLDNNPDGVIVGKSISEEKAYNLYFALNITGMLLGFYITTLVDKTSFFSIFIISSALLYLYATNFKQTLLIGNIIVSLVTALSILIVGVFDVIPNLTLGTYAEYAQMKVLLYILLDYAIFAFLLNFIREIVKDMEDVDGDNNQGMRTLPIVLGIAKTSKVVFGLGLFSTVFLMWYINTNMMSAKLYYAVLYDIVFLVGPLLFFSIKIFNAATKKEFTMLSALMKWVIFFGVLSIVVVNLNIKYRA